MTPQEILTFLSSASVSGLPFWGAVVATADDVAATAAQGASWATVTHACALDRNAPSSVIGLLPYASANAETLRCGTLAAGAPIPLLAGVFAADQFTRLEYYLDAIWHAGYRGVQNFPSVGLAEGRFAMFTRESGMDYSRELAMAALAREKGFFVSAIVFSPEQAEAMVKAGAEMLVFHPGLNADGEIRGRTQTTLQRFAAIAAAARSAGQDILLTRLAFEREDAAGGAQPHGIQYDLPV